MRNEKGQFVKGSSGFTGKHSEETRLKIRAARARQGSNVWNRGTNLGGMKGKHHSEETRMKIGEAQKGEKNHMFGKRGPNWKGGITPLVFQIRGHFKYRQWRSDIFQRDDFTCVLCGDRGGKLNADHFPKRFSDIFHQNKIENLDDALACEEFWNLNNGRTLCVPCHKKIPTKMKGDGKR